MARAKVGGTSGKRRGYVGDTLYQVTRNDEGKVVQLQRAKELSREYSNTDQQALNRMLMGTIEMAMASCKGHISDTFEGARSVKIANQMFSAYNMQLIQQDCREHWREGNLFDYPPKGRKDRRGGAFLVSDGSLSFEWQGAFVENTFYEQYARFQTDLWPTGSTFGEVSRRLGIQAGDTLKFFAFAPDNLENKGKMFHFYVAVTSNISNDFVLTENNYSQVFSVYGNNLADMVYFSTQNGDNIAFRLHMPVERWTHYVRGFAVVLMRYNRGTKRISRNRLLDENGRLAQWDAWESPYYSYNYYWLPDEPYNL